LQLPESGPLKGAVAEDLAFNYQPDDQAFKEQFFLKPALAYVTVTKTLPRGQIGRQQTLLERLEKRPPLEARPITSAGITQPV
jgi:hypothetical protein